ncbi:hypothetical protein Val02_46030 [Virgisporangium aliadipatigenens]|uniref:Uncharacterized protein n=1 Tax=Virgisporangium aliadipatigenens TaxID=741659 RepID=A0A8J3YNK7_9ACTN|nr:hypothetical protein [Virgisporangium aliadipatigenens]GIJ47717.1 hypothetical protein Val02_46030 [Virgisporangium aliadipatigenens]
MTPATAAPLTPPAEAATEPASVATGLLSPEEPARPAVGRHRLGTAGLRHCREIDSVGSRLNRRAPDALPARHWRAAVGGGAVVGLVAVSSWYTAAGAAAVAQMVK